LLLSEFDYKIEHTKGRPHTLADSLSRRSSSQEERDQAEKMPARGRSPIPVHYFRTTASGYGTSRNIWKSHSRHYRRHAKITNFAPITLRDTAQPAAPNSNAAQQQQLPIPSADNGTATAPFPTVDDIVNSAENLPSMTLETQRQDKYFFFKY
jgi:hypothetical protein